MNAERPTDQTGRSLQDLAATKLAIEVCNHPDVKREILCAPESDYVANKSRYESERKKQWSEAVKKKTLVILENFGLQKLLQEKVISIVIAVGMRMLIWAVYHEGTFNFSRDYTIGFFNRSLFTSRGIVDGQKAAEELLKSGILDVKHLYKLACIYCFIDHIPSLFRQLTEEDLKDFYNAENPNLVKQPELVKFWSYYLMCEIDKLRGDESVELCRLHKAIESGSLEGVEFCWKKLSQSEKDETVVDAAIQSVKNTLLTMRGPSNELLVVFRNRKYDERGGLWVPYDYYVDILCFLLSEMRDYQKLEFFGKEIEGIPITLPFEGCGRSVVEVLQFFLEWPYQDYFMKVAELSWDILPKQSYVSLLSRIIKKFDAAEEGSSALGKHGEKNSFDYRELLKVFWGESPDLYKGYSFTMNYFPLHRLFNLKHFSHEDGTIAQLILASATIDVKEKLISSNSGKMICLGLMEEEKWNLLDDFVRSCSPSLERATEFKREFTFSKQAMFFCLNLIRNEKWGAAELFINWSALTEEQVFQFKKEVVTSDVGKHACVDIFFRRHEIQIVDRIISWCLSSEEEIKELKKELLFFHEGIATCNRLLTNGKLELLDEYINWGISSEEDILAFKKQIVLFHKGIATCNRLLTDGKLEIVDKYINWGISSNEDVAECKKKFAVNEIILEHLIPKRKWEQSDALLKWHFSSDDEIKDFKRQEVLEKIGQKIHFNLIYAKRWEEAELFFSWLGLSAEEIREFKKECLFSHSANRAMFDTWAFSNERTSKRKAMRVLLRWYFTDQQMTLEFRDHFKNRHDDLNEEQKACLDDFDSVIEQHLKYLNNGIEKKIGSCIAE